MGFKVSSFLSCCAILIVAAAPTKALDTAFKNSLENFGQQLYHQLVQSHGNEYIIYSPFSIQNCLTMARMGADGQTATEMDQAMGYTGQSLESVADNYNTLLNHYENSSFLQLATKIFVNNHFELNDNYNDILSHKFNSAAESIDFGKSVEAAATVNNWVESKTNGMMKQLVSSDKLASDTLLLLLSVIHFKGNWVKPFLERNTKERDFFIDETHSIKVPMMSKNSRYEIGVYPELGATALRLPYKDSDLSMLIFLPDSRTGLSAMEEKLSTTKLTALTEKMVHRQTEVQLPKFKVEFEIELTNILQKLGMKNMFAQANFSKMLKTAGNIKVSSVLHKAVIEVNERGTEAAAATVLEMVPYSMPKMFFANHPFHYKIVNTDNVVFFEGNVVKF